MLACDHQQCEAHELTGPRPAPPFGGGTHDPRIPSCHDPSNSSCGIHTYIRGYYCVVAPEGRPQTLVSQGGAISPSCTGHSVRRFLSTTSSAATVQARLLTCRPDTSCDEHRAKCKALSPIIIMVKGMRPSKDHYCT